MTTPTANEEWIDPIFDAVVSDVQASGYFDRVNQHEPKKAPGHGLTAAVWFQGWQPLPQRSGLASTSGVILWQVRIYQNMLAEPQDEIDPMMMRAASNLIRRYHDDFDFGLDPLVSNVDVFGSAGAGALTSAAGYLPMENNKLYRIIDIMVPVIVNDIWTQVK